MKTATVLMLALIAGCATPVQYAATGGSKADGTVELSYDVYPMMEPVPDEAQGQSLAIDRCKAWGYGQAEAFGGGVKECYDGDCMNYRVSKQYQCVDGE